MMRTNSVAAGRIGRVRSERTRPYSVFASRIGDVTRRR
jgi:hypothetical protein